MNRVDLLSSTVDNGVTEVQREGVVGDADAVDRYVACSRAGECANRGASSDIGEDRTAVAGRSVEKGTALAVNGKTSELAFRSVQVLRPLATDCSDYSPTEGLGRRARIGLGIRASNAGHGGICEGTARKVSFGDPARQGHGTRTDRRRKRLSGMSECM